MLNKTTDAENAYVLYNNQKLYLRDAVSCGATEDPFGGKARLPDFNTINSTERSSADRCVSVYFECDYNTFLTYNSNVGEVVFKIESTFNHVQQIYAEEGVTIQIAGIKVYTDPDPEVGEFIAVNLLDQKANRLKNNFPGNLAHFVTTKNVGDGGRGYIGGKHSLSSLNAGDEQSPFSDYSRDVYLVAHEIGHNLGSYHTHACVWGVNGNEALDNCSEPEGFCIPGTMPTNGGTIMSYCMLNTNVGINFSNGFGAQPGAVIRQGAESFNCMKRGCTSKEACNYNPFAEEDDGSCLTGYDADLFSDYPFLNDKINSEECSESGAILYKTGPYEYMYVFKPDGNVLYYPDSPGWECRDRSDYNCRQVYNLTDDHLVKSSCGCGGCDEEPEICNTNPCINDGVQNWNDNTCACEVIEPTVSGCDDQNAINFDPLVNCPDNSLCRYDYECTDTNIFDKYSWLSTVTDRNSCDFNKITVITNNYYSYIYVAFSDKGVLYAEDGAVWATDNGDYYYVNWYIENAGYYQIACYNCVTGSCTYSNTGTFFFDDCGGENYYFIQLSDDRIFDPYLTDEDYARFFGSGRVQEIEVKFDYVLNEIGNPCNIQTIDITCIEYLNPPNCNNNTGTFFTDDCGGSNYFFIQLEDGTIFDPYLTDEDYERIFGNGMIDNVAVKFDYVLSGIENPCDIQAIDITCIESVSSNTCNDGIKNGNEKGVDCGGDICISCIFVDYPELLDLVDHSNCNGETIMVFDYITYTYIYVGNNNEGALYYAGYPFCEDAPGYSCLSAYHLSKSNAIAVWTCGEVANKQNSAPKYINGKIGAASFNMYPNPNKRQVFIHFDRLASSDSILNIYDIDGRKVFTQSLEKEMHEKKIELNLNELIKGIYFVEIEGKEFKQTQKLLMN